MKRLAAILVAFLAASACADDQVVLERGPLGPASYDVEVTAEGGSTDLREHREASLRIDPQGGGADFALRTEAGGLITAELRRSDEGSVNLERVRGVTVERAGQAELASLVGQLDPPLPRDPVRIGERWSSSRRIRTDTLRATLRTQLGIARFRRIASMDTAELEGTVTGRLNTTSSAGTLSGTLEGRTRIAWAVRAGRVVAADTTLIWTLSDGDQVTLLTRVRPR
jgi:hypothetical protein